MFVGIGVEKIRLTGGEPLLRRDIEKLIEMLAAMPGLSDLDADHQRLAADAQGAAPRRRRA